MKNPYHRWPVVVRLQAYPPQVLEGGHHIQGEPICAEFSRGDRPLLLRLQAPLLPLRLLPALHCAPVHLVQQPPRHQHDTQTSLWVGGLPSSIITTLFQTCRCQKCTRIAVRISARPLYALAGQGLRTAFLGNFILKVLGSFPPAFLKSPPALTPLLPRRAGFGGVPPVTPPPTPCRTPDRAPVTAFSP